MTDSTELTHDEFQRALDLVVEALAAELPNDAPVRAALGRLDDQWDDLHPVKNEPPLDQGQVDIVEAARVFVMKLRDAINRR